MADQNSNQQQPVTDDQELAKVLASMSDDANQQQTDTPQSPTPQPTTPPPTDQPADDVPMVAPAPATDANEEDDVPQVAPPPVEAAPVTSEAPAPLPVTGGLDDIKKLALDELRPIVDKLELPPEEKFDALLLVIRSSDDQSLIKAAYDAAERISDEGKKAQALLDVVKEIEYFSQQHGITPTES